MIRKNILGVPVDIVTMDSAMSFIHEYLHAPRQQAGFVLAVNPEKVLTLRENPSLLEFFKQATMLIPDGIGVVKAMQWQGETIGRVPGADLMQRICAESVEHQYKLFIYGGSEEVNSQATEELRRRYPGINIVGRESGFLPQDKMPELVKRINDSEAEVLFIALGSPRQENWMQTYAGELTTVKLCQGIGGTLDTITGAVKRAPLAWQKLNLEWFYRLLCQPTRIKRQVRLFKFLCMALKERFSPNN